MEYVNDMAPVHQEHVGASYRAIAHGGLSEEIPSLVCYVDYTIHEYLLGTGSSTLTIAYDLVDRTQSYGLYLRSHENGGFGSAPVLDESEYSGIMLQTATDAANTFAEILEGSESVVFLAPMETTSGIAVEAWGAVAQWDIQQAEDGAINAVRYGVSVHDPESTQTLANLKSRITAAAAAGDAHAGKRIASISGLNAHYREIGAYGDITPGDGKSDTFTPAQPPPKHAPPPASLRVTAAGEAAARAAWNAVSGAAGYRLQRRIAGEETAWTGIGGTLTGVDHAAIGLRCGKTHEFRVGAFGDGATYSDQIGLWSATASTTLPACTPQAPKFGAASYFFEITTLAKAGDPVGTVAAIDVNGDRVRHEITAGNASGVFAINSDTGELTVTGNLAAATRQNYTLTIRAADAVTGSDTATATITVVDPGCDSGAAVADPLSHHWLVQDCVNLLAAKPALTGASGPATIAGSGNLNWNATTAITSWDGITVTGTPARVTEINLEVKSLAGTIPAELANLSRLARLNLGRNSLTGTIPPELANLSRLTGLSLNNNSLTGSIPPELSRLLRLTGLRLDNNSLTGEIPQQLVNLTGLTSLRLLGTNALTGCAPAPLREVADNDLASSGLPACTPPAFPKDVYTFLVLDGFTGVGRVTAGDAPGETLAYSIISGNESGKFAIQTFTDADGNPIARLRAATPFDYATAREYRLTLRVEDPRGYADTAEV